MSFLCLVACATSRGVEAQRLVDAGRAPAALELWTARLREVPDDAEASRGRRFVLGLLANQRCAGAASVAQLVEVQRLIAQGAAVPQACEAARRRVEAEVREAVQAPLGLGQPLAARRVLGRLSLDEAGLTSLRVELEQAIARVGARRCAVLSDSTRTLHLAAFVARYCAAFQAAGRRVGAAPERRAGLLLEVSGVPAAVVEATRSAFERSAWFDPAAGGSVEGRLAGRLESALESTPITVTAQWSEVESYTVNELQTETYQETYTANEYVSQTTSESYTTTELRPVSVSYTAYESYTYSCGSYPTVRTCSGTRPVTKWRTEQRSETVTRYRPVTRQVMQSVTKYRPATRQVSKPVTRTRSVGRSFAYPAVNQHATHRAQVTVAVALPGTERSLEVPYSAQADQTDDEHQVTHPAAGLLPHRAAVLAPEAWQRQVAGEVGALVADRLDEAWRVAFCGPSEQAEAAARCVGSRRAEAGAWQVVARFFGEPEEELRALVR